jgi:hypothetical protein
MTGMFTIILFFIIQQLVSFTRIFLRFSHLRIAAQYLKIKPIAIPEPKLVEVLDETEEEIDLESNQESTEDHGGELDD